VGAAKPWLPMHPNFTEFCTESQRRNPASIWMFYRDLISLRKQHKALVSHSSVLSKGLSKETTLVP